MTDAASGSLAAIVAYARAGALEHAWTLFLRGGHDRTSNDPRALTVKGRLLKDRAGRAAGKERAMLCRAAAAAYRQAADQGRSTYPLINAATLHLLAGDNQEAERLAARTLELLREAPDEPETPYYRGATAAEALLVLGRRAEAEGALSDAIALAPRAWEDHASTLHQFALILREKQSDETWLDSYRPPCSIHFGGHMSFDPDVGERAHLEETIAAILEEERVGFGFGALAAGADIIVAEALLARGGELHLVLPGGTDAFASRSVDPFGAAWRRRFDALIERAESVRAVRPLGVSPETPTIALADEVAMGAALNNAARLEGRALQLLVVDPQPVPRPGGSATRRAQERWARSGRLQRLVPAPREAVAPPQSDDEGEQAGTPRALLSIWLDDAVDVHDLPARIGALRATIPEPPRSATAPYWNEGQVLVGYSTVLEAAEASMALAASGYRVGGDYLIAEPFIEPLSGGERLQARITAAAAAAAASTPPGSACVTEDFAFALAVSGELAPISEYVGELEPASVGTPIALFALKPRPR